MAPPRRRPHPVEWNAQLRAQTVVAQVDKPLEHHTLRRVPFAVQARTRITLEQFLLLRDGGSSR
ncbi:MAG: hypothetical protein M3069_24090 [Chloroflexota bacterium]|nr:hypothetical protein [Chloroflexota bacterium]